MAIKGQAINVTITAIDASTGKRKTGDSANISVYLIKDGTAAARNDATAISETDATNCPGEYTVELDAIDMNANTVVVTGKSSTANIEIIPVKIVTEVGKIAALQADTDDIQTRIPDALVGGSLKSNVTSIATDAITAASIKADAITKIQNGLMLAAGYTTPPTTTEIKTAIEAAGSSIASILADTAELQTDWVDGGRLDLLIDAIKAKTDTYVAAPTTAEIKTALEIAGGTLALILADTGELQTDWVNGGRLDLLIDAIKAKTDNLPATPAAVGSAMTLADDAITAAKFDESTAFPIKSADTGATQIARTGADADTLETLSDEIAGVSGGTPLTAQEVRDAMKLAPSAGAAAADSIDGDLDDIQTRLPAALVDGKMDSSATVALSAEDIGDISDAVIAGLGGATVVITSPISQSNDVTILRDTDYTTEIVWTYTYSGSLTGYTAALHCRGAGITSHTVTIGGIAGAYTLTAAFTNTETAALDTCIDDYSITFTKTADNTVLPYGVEGVMIVRDWGGI